MNKKIIIGSRGSKLALIYAEIVKEKIIDDTDLDEKNIEIKKIVTKGDQVQDRRLSDLGGKGLFSSNIEKELFERKIDIAVHALKDLPAIETKGLIINAYLERNDPREILISNNKTKFRDLKPNSIIGTSSYRREFQINNLRTDLICKTIRGNVDTRIKKLKEKSFDAILLAYAGIKSLKLENQISEVFSVKDFIPSAGQGIISLQCREDDVEVVSLLKKINHPKTSYIANAERNVLKVLEGNCETAVGAYAIIKENKIILEAELFSLDGKQKFYEKKSARIEDAAKLGNDVGKILKAKSKDSYKR
tara:strand:+ start:41 stop:958 length:918 start_codon:yes stop_codon:yes gene_type:complete